MFITRNASSTQTEEEKALDSNDFAYGENMTTIKKPKLKPKVEIGFGKNFYYNKDFDNPIKEYQLGSYLEFSLENKELLDYIYQYFNFNKQQKETLSPAKGWLRPGASEEARRPNMYFKSEKLLFNFLDYLSKKVDLVEVNTGLVVSSINQEKLIRGMEN